MKRDKKLVKLDKIKLFFIQSVYVNRDSLIKRAHLVSWAKCQSHVLVEESSESHHRNLNTSTRGSNNIARAHKRKIGAKHSSVQKSVACERTGAPRGQMAAPAPPCTAKTARVAIRVGVRWYRRKRST